MVVVCFKKWPSGLKPFSRQGWANVDEIVEVLKWKRADFGISDGQHLRDILSETDMEGRFQIDARGRLKKVQRELRLPRKPTSAPSKSRRTTAAQETSIVKKTEDGSELPPVLQASSGRPTETADGVPEKPPGEHWTKYTDDGALWWYYEGPKGKWWMQNTDERPQPWTEEE